MILYEITFVPLKEELRYVEPILLSLFYFNDAAFDGSARRSVAQLRLLIDRGPVRGYFHKPSTSIFIADNLEEKEAVKS